MKSYPKRFQKYKIGDVFVVDGNSFTYLTGVLIEVSYVIGLYRIKWTSSIDSHSWVHSYSTLKNPAPHIRLVQNGIDKLDDIL